MEENKFMTALELMKKLKLKFRDPLRCNYLIPALEMELIDMASPLNPTSKN